MENLVLNFGQALALYLERPDKSRRSLLLEPEVRLVQLATDRFGVQYKNTYVVRICANGLYVINSGPMIDQTAPVISKYSPLKIFRDDHGRWMTPNGPFKSACIVDGQGREIGNENTKGNQST